MNFVKMHGLGNDYVYVEGFTQDLGDPHELARKVADRHFGVGGDGLILALPPEPGVEAHARMRMFNVDGSEGEMCGNGVRCVCKFVHDHNLGGYRDRLADPQFPGAMLIQTGHGVLSLAYDLDKHGKVATVAVDMGRPILDLPTIPVDASQIDARLDGAEYVSMGNPHVVLFFEQAPGSRPLEDATFGAELEHHPAFPNRVNVHFARVLNKDEVEVYHWERGSGATLACGTGACAVCVAGVRSGRTRRKITARLPGGDLQVEWQAPPESAGASAAEHSGGGANSGGEANSEGGSVIMTGPATEVFTGVWPE